MIKFLRNGCLVVLGIFVLLVVVALIAAPPDTESTSSLSSTEASPGTNMSAATPTPLPVMGNDVVVGEVRWKVLSAENLGNVLVSDNPFNDDLPTSGMFIRVRYEVENRSDDTISYNAANLVDDQEREYTHSSDAFFAIEERERCVFEILNPNIVRTCTHIYEVPSDATGLKALLGDLELFGNKEALVVLGL